MLERHPTTPTAAGKHRLAAGSARGDRPTQPDTPPARIRPTRRRYRRAVRGRNSLTATTIPSLVAFTVAFFGWFQNDRYFATGDVVPFERRGLFGELGWLWTHGHSGGGSPNFEVARLFEIIVIRLVELIGGGGADAQRVWLSLCFAFAAFGGSTLGWALTRRATPTVVSGLAAAFNAYLLVQIPNPIPMVTIGVMGMLTAQIVAVARGGKVRPLRFALTTLSCSFLAINPPLLAVAAGWIVLVALAAKPLSGGVAGAHRRSFTLLARAFPWAVALNLWWVAYLVMSLRHGGEGVTLAANTDVVSWSWTQRNSTPGNVLTLLTHWGWGRTEYFPFSTALEGPVWAGFRWLLPLGVFLAPLLTRGAFRRLSLWLVVLVGVFVLAAKGLNQPFPGINLWAYGHVPGFWLLREPMSKIGSILVLLLCGGWALTLDGVGERLEHSRTRWLRATPVVIAALAIAFPLPLWTGAVSRQETTNGRVKHVEVPAAWDTVASAVNTSPERGKALVLPLNDYYQVPTTWGMYGADHLARRYFDRPVLLQRPGGYFGEAPAVVSMMREVERAGAAGDTEGVPSLLRSLAVSHVVVRRDIDRSSPVRPVDMVDGERVIAGLDAAPGLRKIADTEVAAVYELTDSETVQIRRALVDASGVAPEYLADVVVGGDDELSFVTAPGDAPVVGHATVTPWATGVTAVIAGDDAQATVTRRSQATPLFLATAIGAPGDRSVVLSEADVARFDGEPLPARAGVSVPTGKAEPEAVLVGDRLVALSDEGALVPAHDGVKVVALATRGDSVLAPHEELADCNRADDRPIADLGFVLRESGDAVQLSAAAHAACIAYPSRTATAGYYLLSAQVQHGEGAAPRVCVWLEGPDRCATIPPAPAAEQWSSYRTALTVPDGTTAVKVVVYAETTAEHPRTVNAYSDVRLTSLTPVGSATAAVGDRQPFTTSAAAGNHDTTVELGGKLASLGQLSAVKDCNRTDDRSAAEAGISASAVAGEDAANSVTLRALAHSACVSAPVENFEVARSYEVSFEYRWVGGEAPRVCVYQHGPNRCDRITGLTKATEWTTSQTVIVPEEVSSALELYLYGDGGRFGPTEIAYRNVSVRAVGEETLVTRTTTEAAAQAKASPAPTLRWEEQNPATYSVGVSGAGDRFVLVLSEHYSADWSLSGLPSGATATHLNVDGYRNGWVIDPGGQRTMTLSLRHVPSHHARWTLAISALALLAAAATACWVLANREHSVRRHAKRRGRHRLAGSGTA